MSEEMKERVAAALAEQEQQEIKEAEAKKSWDEDDEPEVPTNAWETTKRI